VKGRLLVHGRVQIVVDAWDQVDGNESRRRLGLYALGYEVVPEGGPERTALQRNAGSGPERTALRPNAAGGPERTALRPNAAGGPESTTLQPNAGARPDVPARDGQRPYVERPFQGRFTTILFDRLGTTPDAARLVYAPGRGTPL